MSERSWKYLDNETGKWKVVIEGIAYPVSYDTENDALKAIEEGVRILNEGVTR